jgi:hypothetical protein
MSIFRCFRPCALIAYADHLYLYIQKQLQCSSTSDSWDSLAVHHQNRLEDPLCGLRRPYSIDHHRTNQDSTSSGIVDCKAAHSFGYSAARTAARYCFRA